MRGICLFFWFWKSAAMISCCYHYYCWCSATTTVYTAVVSACVAAYQRYDSCVCCVGSRGEAAVYCLTYCTAVCYVFIFCVVAFFNRRYNDISIVGDATTAAAAAAAAAALCFRCSLNGTRWGIIGGTKMSQLRFWRRVGCSVPISVRLQQTFLQCSNSFNHPTLCSNAKC